MLACGLCVAGHFDGYIFTKPQMKDADAFYTELKPISAEFEAEALAVSGLDRRRLMVEAPTPEDAMARAADWINRVAGDSRPVLVGFPLAYDWMFFYWYLERFAPGRARLTHSSGLDMKTMYQQKARVVLDEAGKSDLPAGLMSTRPHTHNALDDAREQADLFARLFEWRGRDDLRLPR